jgi:DNA helicase-2/ATP-dependent DNA helicase PcrA
VIAGHLEQQRTDGQVSVGIYAKTNQDAAELSSALTKNHVDHVPIGFGEAYGEALLAMVTMLEFAVGLREWGGVAEAFAVVLTATVRSTNPPSLAVSLTTGVNLPRILGERLVALQGELREAHGDAGRLATLVAEAWDRLGFTSGRRAWQRAGRNLTALIARQRGRGAKEVVTRLALSIAGLRNESFVELDSGDSGAIQLMNFHQTKGREADVVILSHSSDDWYGRDAAEPFDEPSRVLYVSLTRARHRVIVLLPPSPHPLVAPFSDLAR